MDVEMKTKKIERWWTGLNMYVDQDSIMSSSTLPQPHVRLTKLTFPGALRQVWLFPNPALGSLIALASSDTPAHQPRPPLLCRLIDQWRERPTTNTLTVSGHSSDREQGASSRYADGLTGSGVEVPDQAGCTLVAEIDRCSPPL